MSQKLLEAIGFYKDFALVFSFIFFGVLAIIAISAIVYFIARKISKKYEKNIHDKEQKMDLLDDEYEKEESEEKLDVLRQKSDKANKVHNISNTIIDVSWHVLIVIWAIAVLVLVIESSSISPKVSDLTKINNETTNTVIPTAYYVIDYKYADKVTLVVFIKNNSNKTIDNLVLREENTSTDSVVEYLEPGEEKFVSIEVFPTANDEYNFEIEEVNYKE